MQQQPRQPVGARPRPSTAASTSRPASRRGATAPAHRASSSGSPRTCAPATGSASRAPRPTSPTTGTGEITGQALNWVGWPPFDVLVTDPNEPVQNPYVALSDSTTDETVYVGQGDGAGNFDIQNVPAGTYNMAIWDEQLTYIIRFLTVTVADGEVVRRSATVGVSRWFGWLSGDVYLDENGDQIREPGEPGIPNTDVDQRWRDGSIKEDTFTDPTGHYEYPTAEGGPLGKWIISEQGFGRLGVTGATVYDEHTGEATSPVPTAPGRCPADQPAPHRGPPGRRRLGQAGLPRRRRRARSSASPIWGTTRNEFDARMQAHRGLRAGGPRRDRAPRGPRPRRSAEHAPTTRS